MSMDIYGMNPEHLIGEHVKFSVQTFRPMWETISTVSRSIISEKLRKTGQLNGGHGLAAHETNQLVQHLVNDSTLKEIDKIRAHWDTEQSCLVEAACWLCEARETMEVHVDRPAYSEFLKQEGGSVTIFGPGPSHQDVARLGIVNAWAITDYKKIAFSILASEESGECQICKGVGTCDPFLKKYSFGMQDVDRFTLFMQFSGGFIIK